MTYEEYLQKIRQSMIEGIEREYNEMIQDTKDPNTAAHLFKTKVDHLVATKNATEISQLIEVMRVYGYDIAGAMAMLVWAALDKDEFDYFTAERTWIPIRGWDT